MIFIVDNGEFYSSHEITFVDVPDAWVEVDRSAVERLLVAADSNASILGAAREIAWRRRGECVTAGFFLCQRLQYRGEEFYVNSADAKVPIPAALKPLLVDTVNEYFDCARKVRGQ